MSQQSLAGKQSASRVGVVADDLTGAADAGAPFARAGWPVRVRLGDQPLDAVPGAVSIISTGVRAAGEQPAAEVTARAVGDLRAGGAARLYVKIDSVGRGSVAGQVRGALRGWSGAHPEAVAVVCPALPAQGRTVEDAVIMVGGRPAASGAAADDPATPLTEDRLTRRLVARATAPASLAGQLASAGPGEVIVVDARSEADLALIAAAVLGHGPSVVAVGSAGLAAAIARSLPAPRRGPATEPAPAATVVVAASSLHDVTARQLRRLEGRDDAVLVIGPSARRPDGASLERWADEVAGAVVGRLSGPEGSDLEDLALVLVGGDGAGLVLRRLGALGVDVHSELAPGVPQLSLVGGPVAGLRVATKSGGFGSEHTLLEVVDRLRGVADGSLR